MARSGRSYRNVPVIVRGAPEDLTDFTSKTQIIVVAPPRSRPALPPVILRNTLIDPPVLTTPAPVVVAVPQARRLFATRPPLTLTGSVPPPPPVTGTGLLLTGFI